MVIPMSASQNQRATAEDERLLALFSNRVELKKSFEDIRAERNMLRESLSEANDQVRALTLKLEYLEQLLTDGDRAAETVLYYRLRGLWRRFARHLYDCADLMSRRIVGRRKVNAIETWQASQKRKIEKLDDKLRREEQALELSRRQLLDNEQAAQRLRRSWRYWLRRRLARQRLTLSEEVKARSETRAAFLDHKKSLRLARPPASIGLTVEDKRTINLHLLALAQFLQAHAERFDLLDPMARVMAHELGAVSYDDETRVSTLMRSTEQCEAALNALESDGEIETMVARQARHLQTLARFERPDDVLPGAFLGQSGEPSEQTDVLVISSAFAKPAEVIAGNHWQFSEVLVR